MAKSERQQQVVALIEQRGELRLADLAGVVDASAVTLRRDLRELAERGRISYLHGLARARSRHTMELAYEEKRQVAVAEKALIGRAAAELVHDGDAVVLGAGSTTLELARCLVDRSVEVWTNSLLVAEALADARSVRVRLAGGDVRGAVRALVGSRAERSFAGLRAPLAFLSGNGLTWARGLTTPNLHVAEIDRAMAAAAVEVVALVDHTKVGVESLITTVPTARLARVVTDRAAQRCGELEQLVRRGVRVQLVD